MAISAQRQARFKRMILLGTTVVVLAGIAAFILSRKLRGKGLNSRAWRASYRERLLPVPSGPREGWWGVNLSPVHDGQLGMVLPERHVPGFFAIERGGLQLAVSGPEPRTHLLIIGGSVAAGAYASNLGRAYFRQLAHRLGDSGMGVKVTVLATGAWTSVNELQAFRLRGISLKPDYVIFLNGLNDLILFKDWSEEKRVKQYLDHMREARDLALENGIKVVFAPQPFLPEKKMKSWMEKRVIEQSLKRGEHLEKTYGELRKGLRSLLTPGQAYMADCSTAFHEEAATTFADIWHFSDVGHSLLAEKLADDLKKIISPAGRAPRSALTNSTR